MGAQLINAALDISALFEARKDVISRATRFTSKAPPKKILDAVEETVIAQLQGSVKRRGDSTRRARCPRCFCLPLRLDRLLDASLSEPAADVRAALPAVCKMAGH